MADGLHIPIWNRTMKPLAIALSMWGGSWGERWLMQLNSVQFKSNQNCH
jgi:hypothetical protein